MKNILYIHQYFNTVNMSGGTWSCELARRMVASGHRVTMLISDQSKGLGLPRRECIEGINVIWVPRPDNKPYGPLRKMAAFALFSIATSWYALILECSSAKKPIFSET